MKNKIVKLISIIIAILTVLVVIFFLCQDLVINGQLEFKTDFKKFTPFVSILKLQESAELKDLVYIKKQPIWFDIYMPRDFDKIRLEFIFKNDYNYKIEVGPKIYEENNPLEILDDGQDGGDTIKTKSLEFDLQKLPVSKGKLRFMLSIPDLDEGQGGIYIKELKVNLQRPALWQEGVIQNFTNYFNYYRNEFR